MMVGNIGRRQHQLNMMAGNIGRRHVEMVRNLQCTNVYLKIIYLPIIFSLDI